MVNNEIQKAQILRLDTPLDLFRLVVSNAQNRGAFLYYGIKDGKHLLAISHLVPGWYNLRGLPITLVAEIDDTPKTNIIRYKFAGDDVGEDWEFVDQFTSDSKYVYLPIIKVAEFPEFLL